MKNLNLYSILLFITLVAVIVVADPASAKSSKTYSAFSNACTSREFWKFGSAVPAKWQKEYQQFLSKRTSNVYGFSQALALRRLADVSPEARVFAEYWVSRALLSSDLTHIAQRGFKVIAMRPVKKSTFTIQAAAAQCLLEIQSKYPTMGLPDGFKKQIIAINKLGKVDFIKKVTWRAAGAILRDEVATGAKDRHIRKTMRLLKGAGPDEYLAKLVYSARTNQHKSAIRWGKKFLKTPGTPSYLGRYMDPARILYARSLYTTRNYREAANQFKTVKKQSNELVRALSDLSWSYLMSEQYREAIGTAINLQSGGLRNTFSPEAPMVMAMAFNEFCQYPRAVEAVGVFRKHYRPSFVWLSKWHSKKNRNNFDFYGSAIKYLKQEPVKIPNRIISEWVRSPLFIARQDQINLLFDEKDATKLLGKKGDKEQSILAGKLLVYVKEFKERYKRAKIRMQNGEKLSAGVKNDLLVLRDQVEGYRRYRKAAPVWRMILKNHQKKAPKTIKVLKSRINRDLRRMSYSMRRKLAEIAENNYFIEVEIYNGASKDIIWKNAYPDYEDIAEDLRDDGNKKKFGQVWDWGSVAGGLDGSGEIWEDELGSFKADIYDNCTSKDKYIALKRAKALKKIKRIK